MHINKVSINFEILKKKSNDSKKFRLMIEIIEQNLNIKLIIINHVFRTNYNHNLYSNFDTMNSL